VVSWLCKVSADACTVGVVLNGQQLFQLAADGDPRIKLEGDVQLEIKPLQAPNFR